MTSHCTATHALLTRMCAHTHTHTYTHTYISTYIKIYIYIYKCMCVYLLADFIKQWIILFSEWCTPTHIHTITHTNAQIYKSMCIYIYLQIIKVCDLFTTSCRNDTLFFSRFFCFLPFLGEKQQQRQQQQKYQATDVNEVLHSLKNFLIKARTKYT